LRIVPLARRRKLSVGLVRPAREFPLDVKRIALNDADEAALARTFNRLAQLCHCDQLSGQDKEDCLLLLTTCRNEWYALNAMYVEADQWCREGEKFSGFGDGLDALRRVLSGALSLDEAGTRAAVIFGEAAHYLAEFEKKRSLFFDRFADVRAALERFSQTIPDLPARQEFMKLYVQLGSGPGTRPDHKLSADVEPRLDIVLRHLTDWYRVARPLTGLARTYVSDVLEVAASHDKTCQEYLAELTPAALVWRTTYGYVCPEIPPADFFAWRRSDLLSGRPVPDLPQHIRHFVAFCEDMRQVARSFLREMLPLRIPCNQQFPLRMAGERMRIVVRGKPFERVADMFVFITDMRDSSGKKYLTTELKVKLDEIVDALLEKDEAASEYTHNDCRAVGCISMKEAVRCMTRLWTGLEADRDRSGFAGLRMGASRGDMLVGWRGPWQEDPMLLDCSNTLVTASRLMELDKLRWKTETEQGKQCADALGDWSTDESLVFFDSRFYEALPDGIRAQSRMVGVFDFRGIGNRQCWALPISRLTQMLG
jgi:hypothetical protein